MNNVFDEKLIIDKEKDIRKKEVEQMNRAIKLSVIPGIIVTIAVALYLNAVPQETVSEIIIHLNISKNIETDNESPGIGSYRQENTYPMRIVPIDNLSYFETEGMDRIFATAKFDDRKEKLWLLVRGIKYDKLPHSFDYYEEFEKPYVKDGYMYKTKETSMEIKNLPSESYPLFYKNGDYATTFSFEQPYLSNPFDNRPNASPHKIISIRYSRIKYGINHIAFTALGAIVTSFATFIVIMSRTKNNKAK